MEWKIWIFSRGRYEERTQELQKPSNSYGIYAAKRQEQWYLETEEGYYLTGDTVMKKGWIPFEHGAEIEMHEEDSGLCLYRIFLQRWKKKKKASYGYAVCLKREKPLYIGGETFCHIHIQDIFLRQKWMEIRWKENAFWVWSSTWEIAKNGMMVQAKAQLREHDFVELGGYRFYMREEKIWFDLAKNMVCHGIHVQKAQSERSDYPDYVCRARWRTETPQECIRIAAPANYPEKQESRLLLSLLSSAGILAAAVMLQSRGGFGGGWYRLVLGGMGMATAVVTWLYGKLHIRKKQRKYRERYRAYLTEKEGEIVQATERERRFLEQYERDWKTLAHEAKIRSWNLFEKTGKDWDFLWLRLGNGTIAPNVSVEFQKREDFAQTHTLWREAQEMIARQSKMQNAPVVLRLPECGNIGIVGEEGERIRFLEMLLLELICSHGEEETRIFILGEESAVKKIAWVRTLPHVRTEQGERRIGWDSKSRGRLEGLLERELSLRQMKAKKGVSWVVCFLEETKEQLYFTEQIEKAAEYGIYSIFLTEEERKLPRGCRGKICIREGKGEWFLNESKESIPFFFELPTKESLLETSAAIACAKKKTFLEKQKLPKKLTLFELLEKEGKERWERMWEEEQETLPVALGTAEDGSTFFLDLHEKAHGPHGLVAGTTGSGKSEMILSYLLCAALSFAPWRLQFLLIDFKGGGLANHLKDLPHLAGTITNLDEALLERSLMFIRAELKKRQRMLAENGCAHVDEYEQRYRKRPAQLEAMPHLILIVDEFAELRAEQPEFMKELISASRIGRSLGVHLILATQKPSGQVSEQIWSNAKFRLCLKVQSENDSREVLRSGLAAQILEPGRAYFQVGNNEQFFLFQSAYSSEKIKQEKTQGFQIFRILLGGERRLLYEKKGYAQEGWTEAEAVRQRITQRSTVKYIRKLPVVCLAPLRENIPYPTKRQNELPRGQIPIGILDDPKMQRQPEAVFEMRGKNLLVTGSMGFGKQNLFFVLLRGWIAQYAQEIEIYVADFEGRLPQALERLPQVGGIVRASEEEKLENLVEMAREEMEFRKRQAAWEGEQDKIRRSPVIFVWFSYLEWKKRYPDLEERISAVWREGNRWEIYTVVFQEELRGIHGGTVEMFGCRISLFHQDASAYRQLMDEMRGKLPKIAGRAFFPWKNEVYQMQVYQAFQGATTQEQTLRMEDWIWKCSRRAEKEARKIPVIPQRLSWEIYPICRKKGDVPAAVQFRRLKPVFFGEWKNKITGVCGEEQMEWLSQIPQTCRIFQERMKCFILDDEKRRLQILNKKGEWRYFTDSKALLQDVKECAQSKREEEILLLLNGSEVLEALSRDKEQRELLRELRKEILILCANLENKAIRYHSCEFLQEIRERGQLLFFGEKTQIKAVEIPFGELKKCKERKDSSEIFFWDGTHLEKCKIAAVQEENTEEQKSRKE